MKKLTVDDIIIWLDRNKFLYDDAEDLAFDCMCFFKLWESQHPTKVPKSILNLAKKFAPYYLL